MALLDNFGVFLPQRKGKARDFASSIMKEQDSYLVPMEMARNTFASVCVSVGDQVEEGSLLGKPKDRYGCFVYSPVSGKVTAIVQQMSLTGNLVDHVLIVSDKKNRVKTFPSIQEMSRKALVERLMVSGCIGEGDELCYIKYVRKPSTSKSKLIVSCVDNDPYVSSSEVNVRENTAKVVKGALEFQKLAESSKVIFLFTSGQKSAIKALKKYVNENKINNFYIDIIPDIYPMTETEVVRYVTGKTLDASGRFAKGIYLESSFTCKQFYDAVYENERYIIPVDSY